MIEKAKSLDAESAYFHVDLERWSPQQKVDVVHSMEVVYYLQDPRSIYPKCVYKLVEHKRAVNHRIRLLQGKPYFPLMA